MPAMVSKGPFQPLQLFVLRPHAGMLLLFRVPTNGLLIHWMAFNIGCPLLGSLVPPGGSQTPLRMLNLKVVPQLHPRTSCWDDLLLPRPPLCDLQCWVPINGVHCHPWCPSDLRGDTGTHGCHPTPSPVLVMGSSRCFVAPQMISCPTG